MDSETAQRQYALGVLNRRIAHQVNELDRIFHALTGERGSATLLCACGREGGCRAEVVVPLDAYRQVLESPHRFVIAPGHAQAVDEVIVRGARFEIVQIRAEFRLDDPPTA